MNVDNLCMSCFENKGDFEICPYCGWVEGTVPTDVYQLHPRSILNGRYTIGEILGFGGFGITYKAWDNDLEIKVAIKEYYPSGLVNRIPGENEVLLFSGEKRQQFLLGLERFLEEAQNMAMFSEHPFIVNVYNYFQQNNTAYIVMEYLDGLTLKEYLQLNDGILSYEDCWSIFEPVMRALEEVHSKKIIHRDLSPDNIYLTSDNKVKVIDFGAARFAEGESEKTLSVIIKPGYAPPEQYRSKSKQGPFTDVYALGATIYRCITGLPLEESIDRMVNDEVKRPSELGISMPENAEKALMKAIALNDGLRFRKVQDFREAFNNKKQVEYPEIEYKKRKIRRIASAGMVAVLLIIVTSSFYGAINAYLPVTTGAVLDVYIPVSDEQDYLQESYYTSMDEILYSFLREEDYSTRELELNIIPIAKDNYSEKMTDLLNDEDEHNMLFRSDLLTDDVMNMSSSLEDLSEFWVYWFWNRSGCIYAKEYPEYFPNQTEMPVGFVFPVSYVNEGLLLQLGELTPDKYESIETMSYDVSSLNNVRSFTIIDDCVPYLIASLGGYDGNNLNDKGEIILEQISPYIVSEKKAIESFTNSKTIMIIGFTDIDSNLKTTIAGANYSVIPISNNNQVYAKFTQAWSISNNASDNSKELGIAFMNYMLSYEAQNGLCIQNNVGAPVNSQAYEQYFSDIYQTRMGSLAKYINSFTFWGEERNTIEQSLIQ